MAPLFLLVFIGYLASLILYFMDFEMRREALFTAGRRMAAAAWMLHLTLLLLFLLQDPSAAARYSESIAAFLLVTASFYMEARHGGRFLMLFSLPAVLLLSLLGVLHSGQAPLQAFADWWLWLHTGFVLSGLAGLLIAVASAVMYLLQISQLKSKQLGKVFVELPSLETLDRIHFRALAWGVILFSLGLLSGLFWARDLNELGAALKDPKTGLSFLTCFLYWAILSFRLSAMRRGQKIAAGTIFTFVLLLVTFMSSYYAPSAFHRGF